MAGCFGNSFFDRSFESELMRHLDDEYASEMEFCTDCGTDFNINDSHIDDMEDCCYCPNCDKKIPL